MKNEIKLTDFEKGYLAGIIDGEGSFTFWINRQNVGKLTVVNTSKELIDWLQSKFGGNVCKKVKHDGHKQTYAWSVGLEKAAWIARQLDGLLIVKKEQAKIIIRLADLLPYGQRWMRATKEDRYAQRDLLSAELRLLNKRGENYANA